MSYHAILMSWNGPEEEDPSAFDLPSKEACVEHIRQHLCDICAKDLEEGFIDLVDSTGEVVDRMEITSPMGTGCGAEWAIVSAAEWQEYIDREGEEACALGFWFDKAQLRQKP